MTNSVDSSTSKPPESGLPTGEPDTTPSKPFSVVLEVEVPIPFQALADLVRSLDANTIEGVAMGMLEWGDDKNLTFYILETIAQALEAFDAD